MSRSVMPEGVFLSSRTRNRLTLGADSGTVTIDLPTANYLQGLRIRAENVNGSTSNTDESQTVEQAITKIEVIADGTVVFSMNGEMCRKLAQFDQGDLPPMLETQSASATQWCSFPIKFGRDDFDKAVILPAHMFSSLQLKLTWSFTDSATAGFTTSETNAIVDVTSRWLYSGERVSTPFLKQTEVYSKSPTTTGTEEVNLPVGSGNGSYRRIMFSVREAAIEDGQDVDTFELLVNDSQRVVDDRWDQSQIEDAVRYGVRTTKNVRVYKSTGQTYSSRVSRIQNVTLTGTTCCGTWSMAGNGIAGDRITIVHWDEPATAGLGTGVGTAQDVNLSIRGYGASFATMIDLGTDRLADSLDVSGGKGVSSLKLRYNQNAADSTNRVIAEQLVSF